MAEENEGGGGEGERGKAEATSQCVASLLSLCLCLSVFVRLCLSLLSCSPLFVCLSPDARDACAILVYLPVCLPLSLPLSVSLPVSVAGWAMRCAAAKRHFASHCSVSFRVDVSHCCCFFCLFPSVSSSCCCCCISVSFDVLLLQLLQPCVSCSCLSAAELGTPLGTMKSRSSEKGSPSSSSSSSSSVMEVDEEDAAIIKETKKMGYCYFKRDLSEEEKRLNAQNRPTRINAPEVSPRLETNSNKDSDKVRDRK